MFPLQRITSRLEEYSRQCDLVEKSEESFKSPHRKAVEDVKQANGDLLVRLYLYMFIYSFINVYIRK